MSETVTVEAIKAIPAVLWVIFAVVVFLAFRGTILAQLGRLSSIQAPFFEATFAAELIEEAAAKAEPGTAPTPADRRAAVSRLEHAADILNGGRILWVDDNPDWNRALIDLFRRLRMTVDLAESTLEAMRLGRSRQYDLVITDMRRDTEQPAGTAGVTLIDALQEARLQLPVIVYALAFDPRLGVHPAIFAYTGAIDDLIHYVIDIMERVKFSAAP